MVNSTKETCERYNSYIVNNKTLFKISTAYEGIPQNFAINILAYTVLLGIFIILRTNAWNYGKLSWIKKPKTLTYGSIVSESFDGVEDTDAVQESESAPLNSKGHTTFWQKVMRLFPSFMTMSDSDLGKRCGPDAVIYCQFQRSLMATVAVMMFFSLTLILPLNLFSGSLLNSSQFSSLTIANIQKNNQYLWVHFSVAFGLMLFAFFISNRFLSKLDIKAYDEMSLTIMIKHIPPECCEELSIQRHFQEAYPTVKVNRVQVAHKVDTLIYIYAEKKFMEEALEFCYDMLEEGKEPVMVVPHACGRVMSCQCCHSERCIPVDGVEYYSAEVIRLSNMFVEEKSKVISGPKLPMAFVTFETVQDALLIRRDYTYQNYCCINQGPSRYSSLSNELKTSQWKVAFAPRPHDIIWQNLHKQGWKWFIPVILVNLVVAIIVILLSTPSMVLNLITQFNVSQKLDQLKSPIVAQVAPSLILVLVSALMPMLIYWSDQLSGHWTNTSQSKSVMNKLYAVLVTTVLILPSLGLNSIPEFFKWVFPNDPNTTHANQFRWECIFLPDGGALFCNYLISASFIGTALELLRFGELFLYTCKMFYSKSRAEDQSIAKKVLWEFQYGLCYAWTLALFSMVSAYAVVVPIITPFGLAYLLLKHMVDRYNMIHVNVPSMVHYTVHANAAQLMQIGLVLTQATVTVYVCLRRGSKDPLSICCYLAFIIGLLLSFGRTARRCIMNMACVKYSHLPKGVSGRDVGAINDIIMDEDGFIMVEELENATFIPEQLTLKDQTTVQDILRRKSLVLPSEQRPRTPSLPSYGFNGPEP